MSVSNQVMWNRLISVVEEQAQALIRTAFSTSVREAGDLSAGMYDVDGNMLAQAVTGTPGHVNAMAAAVAHFIHEIGYDNMFEQDVYITNDPWKGTGHLHDITVVSPTFYHDKLIGFFACTAHVVDIGGRGLSAEAASVYEEGLYIPIIKFAERGKVDKNFIKTVRANVREPDQVVGDMYALATCNEVGQRRLVAMLQEFELENIVDLAAFILENSRKATLAKIAELTPGRAESCLAIDGYENAITLSVQLEIQADRVICTYEGTSGVDAKGINVPHIYTKAYTCYALKCAIAPEVPNNTASLAPFEISAPEGTILNAAHPAPVALRHIVGQMLPDTVYGALDQLMPNVVPAEGSSALCNFQVSLRPTASNEALENARRAEVLTFNSGGTGARPSLDGLNATAFPSGVMTMPVEATEQVGPVVIWRKELRPDSGGPGEFRGGLGQYMDIGARSGYEFDFSAMFDRVNHPAQGRRGGLEGAPTTISREDGAMLLGKGKHFVPEGGMIRLGFAGGGGYGDVAARDLASIETDLRYGYISEQVAKQEYGLNETDITRIRNIIETGGEIE